MQQSVLLSAVRAPDGLAKNHVAKDLWRWYRRCIVLSAFDKRALTSPQEPGGGSFTGPVSDIDHTSTQYLYHVDEVPHHAHLHIIHAAEILGFKHPDDRTRIWWRNFYLAAVNDMHLSPETEADMNYRLGDVREQWLKTEKFPR